MSVRLDFSKELRPLVAIALAYAIAAQVLVAGAVNGQIAAAGPEGTSFATCYGAGAATSGSDDDSGAPTHKVVCTLCAAVVCAPGVASADALEYARFALAAAEAPSVEAAFIATHELSEKSSQGPPEAA